MDMSQRASMLLACFAISLDAQQWTEESITARFLEQNPTLRESRARIAMSDAEYGGRTLFANPTVSVSREGAGRTEFYQASQSLPLSGRLPILRLAGVASSQALAADTAFSLWQARCALRAAFYRTLAAQLRGASFEESLGKLELAIVTLRSREREGESSTLDRMRAEQEHSDLLAQHSATRAAQALERGELLSFLPTATSIGKLEGSLTASPIVPALPELTRIAAGNRADLQAQRKRMEQFRLEERAAGRLRIPEPSLIAGLKRAEINSPAIAAGPVVGMSLSIPLFNQGKTEVARYNAEQERIAARIEILTRRMEAEVEAASLAFQIRKQAVDSYAASTSNSGDKMLGIAAVAYQEGEIGILQLLDAYRVRHQSQQRILDLRIVAKLAQIQLESLIGQELPK